MSSYDTDEGYFVKPILRWLGYKVYTLGGYAIRYGDLALQTLGSLLPFEDSGINARIYDPPSASELKFWEYCEKRGEWQTAGTAAAGEVPASNQLRVATFNIYSTEHWTMELVSREDVRFEYQVTHLLPSLEAEVICLNEVNTKFLGLLLAQPWVRRHFVVSHITASHCTPKGNIILARRGYATKMWVIARPKRTAREVVAAQLSNGLIVASIHMTAFEQFHKRRAIELQQVVQVIDSLGSTKAAALILGDFNFHNESENVNIPIGFEDVWRTQHPDDVGNTFDPTHNTMIPVVSPPETRIMRLDRAILRNKEGKIRIDDISHFANHKIPGLYYKIWYLFPSDHYGLKIDLSGTIDDNQ